MNIRYSLVLVFCVAGAIALDYSLKPFPNSLSWDNFGYQLYLPATFIYDDASLRDLAWVNALRTKYESSGTLYQVHQLDNGNHAIQYSCGWAIVYAPAFFVAHFCAKAFGYEADGYSLPYNVAAIVQSFIFILVGIWYLRKILLRYFSEGIVAITILLLCFGTNYFHIVTQNTASPHVVLFTLYALIIWNTIRWHVDRNWIHMLGIAFCCGIACLIRPSEIVCFFIPVLWEVRGVKTLFQKITLLFQSFRLQMVSAIVLVFIIALPQLLYWKYVTGHFIFMSYANPGEGFEFLNPNILNFLFSFRKGWFIYTPLAIFMIAGIYFWMKKFRDNWIFLLVFTALNLYVISSWSTWWYAGSFSSRAIMQSYPVLALPLAAFAQAMISTNRRLIPFACCTLVLITLNLFQTWQMNHGILDGSRMTWAYYKTVFAKTEKPAGADSLLMIDRGTTGFVQLNYPWRYESKLLFSKNFDTENPGVGSSNSSGRLVMDSQHPYFNAFEAPYNEVVSKSHCWIEARATVKSDEAMNENTLIVCSIDHDHAAYGYRTAGFEAEKFEQGAWNEIRMLWLSPEIRSTSDNLIVYLWYRGSSSVEIGEFEVKLLEPKEDW